MSDLTLGGKYKVGFKRFRSEHGNACLMFYPCDASEIPTSVQAYDSFELSTKALKDQGFPGFVIDDKRSRVVSQLCPNAPVASEFRNGEKKLVPSIYCHGNNVTAEEHYGVPMILASHGFLVCSLTF